ncbi:hypothetical protein [Virgifigura deserti]|uniref:hypothetical protein n=1 Tax=Virgifigura deserti TaxID=2268457 RepID=UPI003CCC0F61
MSKYCPHLVALALAFFAFPVAAQDIAGPARALVEAEIKGWLEDPLVIDALKAQNAKHASLTQADIDAMDQQWRAETGASSRPMIDAVLGSPLSHHLATLRENGQGLYTEIFVMDNKGLNVGQSDVSSDYWQGDEAKWKKSYLAGPGAIHIGEIEQDESTQMFQSQISLPVVDPATNAVIGAMTVGVNVDLLTQ